jgi:hypothetical protein
LSRLNPISVGWAKIVPKSPFAGFSFFGLSRLNPHFGQAGQAGQAHLKKMWEKVVFENVRMDSG